MTQTFNPYHAKGTVVFGRIRTFFLGDENPSLFTRINCNIAILYFMYVFFWTLAVSIAFYFGQNMPKAENWNNLFVQLGTKYNIPDIRFAFSAYLIALLIFSVLLMVGIGLVWRSKLGGYYLVFTGLLVCGLASVILLGMNYVKNENGWWEFVIPAVVLCLFTVDFMIKRKHVNP